MATNNSLNIPNLTAAGKAILDDADADAQLNAAAKTEIDSIFTRALGAI